MDDRFACPLELHVASEMLGLPPPSVEAMASKGYIASRRDGDGGLAFRRSDLLAFVARNADNGSGTQVMADLLSEIESKPHLDPDDLLERLEDRAEHMAKRVLTMAMATYPEAAAWTAKQKVRFVARTKDRFQALLAIAALGTEVDSSILADLRRVGADAAHAADDLPEILDLLRMSRDLVVQNAVELAGVDGRQGGYALSLVLTRILPAMDRLSDAVASGYWEALLAAS